MNLSVVMTVWNREPEILLATLRSLGRCLIEGMQVIVVNDGSTLNYEWAKSYVTEKLGGIWHDIEPYEAFRIDEGFNNPARVFNQGLLLAESDRLIVMSSDVIVPKRTMAKALRADFSQMVWTPYVEDTDGGPPLNGEYCGPTRLFPMPWFLGMHRPHALEVGGWDETYLKGICYEDNDFVGRLCLKTGRFVGDWSVKVFHQSHTQNAYQYQIGDGSELAQANVRNRDLTQLKWGGIPFDAEYTPFDVNRKMHASGEVGHECIDKSGKLERAVRMTTGLVADRVAA